MLLLDTAVIPVAERIEVFNSMMLDASVPMTITHEHPQQPIHARMHLWQIGVGQIFTSDNTGFRLTRTRRHLAMEGKPYVALALQARGTCRFGQFGHQQIVAAGELMLNDLGAACDVSWSGTGASESFHIGYDHLGLPVDLIRRAAPRLHASPLLDLVRHHLRFLRAEADQLQYDPALPRLGTATTELLRALIVSAAGDTSRVKDVREETRLTRILAYIHRHISEPDLAAERIAGAHGISLRQLYALFQQAGLSLEQWIITQRLEAARADLINPANRQRTIASIARSRGFATPSHFTRRFHAAYGLTPHEWRTSQVIA